MHSFILNLTFKTSAYFGSSIYLRKCVTVCQMIAEFSLSYDRVSLHSKYLPLPRLYTAPDDVNNTACSFPQATDVICLVMSIALNTETGLESEPI